MGKPLGRATRPQMSLSLPALEEQGDVLRQIYAEHKRLRVYVEGAGTDKDIARSPAQRLG